MKYLVIFILAIFLISCTSDKKNTGAESNTIVLVDSFSGYMVADTIVYDVIIKNQNPDDIYAEKFLEHLQRDTLVDMIFDLAYSDKVKVQDHFTGEELSLRDLKKMEKRKDFDRRAIGKLQFTEKWYFDMNNKKMNKEIISITPGYEIYYPDTTGFYKPVFKIILK